ncbi:MAG: hypothetical protein ACK559_12680, partial [bacterium]
MLEFGRRHLLGKGFRHLLRNAAGEAEFLLLSRGSSQAWSGFLNPGFHRGHLGNQFLLTGAVGIAGEGATDGVGPAHEPDISQRAGGISVEEEGFLFLLRLGFGLTGNLDRGGRLAQE